MLNMFLLVLPVLVYAQELTLPPTPVVPLITLAPTVATIVGPAPSSFAPTPGATAIPTASATAAPIAISTVNPTPLPSLAPIPTPTVPPTLMPFAAPTVVPTVKPTGAPIPLPTVPPTLAPTVSRTLNPTATMFEPTFNPSLVPTSNPTTFPTARPTVVPSALPSAAPTPRPTPVPTPRLVVPSPTPRPIQQAPPTAPVTPNTLAPTPDESDGGSSSSSGGVNATVIIIVVVVLVAVFMLMCCGFLFLYTRENDDKDQDVESGRGSIKRLRSVLMSRVKSNKAASGTIVSPTASRGSKSQPWSTMVSKGEEISGALLSRTGPPGIDGVCSVSLAILLLVEGMDNKVEDVTMAGRRVLTVLQLVEAAVDALYPERPASHPGSENKSEDEALVVIHRRVDELHDLLDQLHIQVADYEKSGWLRRKVRSFQVSPAASMTAIDSTIVDCLDAVRIAANLGTSRFHKHLAPLTYRLELNIKKEINRLVDLGQDREDAARLLAENDQALWPIAIASGIDAGHINTELSSRKPKPKRATSASTGTSSMATAPAMSNPVSPQLSNPSSSSP